MNYQYWSLKQLESDILDLASSMHKLNVPGIEVRALNINLLEKDFIKFYTDFSDKTNSPGSTFSIPDKGVKVEFSGTEIYINKVTQDIECQTPTQEH